MRWIVARHEVEALGGIGGTSKRAADTVDPTCPEEAKGASGDQEDLDTTSSVAKKGAIRVIIVPCKDHSFTRS